MSKIGVIDYGCGNIGSVVNIVRKSGGSIEVVDSPDLIPFFDALILPGVGSFDNAMCKIEEDGWKDQIYKHTITSNKILLGICLGMQLLTRGSEEGKKQGLGFIQANTVKFDIKDMHERQRVPHMGWNTVDSKKDNVFFGAGNSEKRFYFVHSYHVVCDRFEDVLTTTDYGYSFASSFKHENIIGVQFHPEKSHSFGVDFFRHFIEYTK